MALHLTVATVVGVHPVNRCLFRAALSVSVSVLGQDTSLALPASGGHRPTDHIEILLTETLQRDLTDRLELCLLMLSCTKGNLCDGIIHFFAAYIKFYCMICRKNLLQSPRTVGLKIWDSWFYWVYYLLSMSPGFAEACDWSIQLIQVCWNKRASTTRRAPVLEHWLWTPLFQCN